MPPRRSFVTQGGCIVFRRWANDQLWDRWKNLKKREIDHWRSSELPFALVWFVWFSILSLSACLSFFQERFSFKNKVTWSFSVASNVRFAFLMPNVLRYLRTTFRGIVLPKTTGHMKRLSAQSGRWKQVLLKLHNQPERDVFHTWFLQQNLFAPAATSFGRYSLIPVEHTLNIEAYSWERTKGNKLICDMNNLWCTGAEWGFCWSNRNNVSTLSLSRFLFSWWLPDSWAALERCYCLQTKEAHFWDSFVCGLVFDFFVISGRRYNAEERAWAVWRRFVWLRQKRFQKLSVFTHHAEACSMEETHFARFLLTELQWMDSVSDCKAGPTKQKKSFGWQFQQNFLFENRVNIFLVQFLSYPPDSWQLPSAFFRGNHKFARWNCLMPMRNILRCNLSFILWQMRKKSQPPRRLCSTPAAK